METACSSSACHLSHLHLCGHLSHFSFFLLGCSKNNGRLLLVRAQRNRYRLHELRPREGPADMVLIIPRIPPLATRSSGWRAWRPTQSSLGGSGWHDEVRCRFAVRRLDFFLFSFCFLFVFFLFSSVLHLRKTIRKQ